ncbi:MAG: LacI family transcriptional regulator [Sphaerospermopsis sp. SIO1G2]|nr:LacI family transcriptional regulator [Sphaerospermopsis sp. SIO1G2]
MSVTIEDISNHLNLSVSTVSKALNGYRDVAPKTRERVTVAAKDLGYHPNCLPLMQRMGWTALLSGSSRTAG